MLSVERKKWGFRILERYFTPITADDAHGCDVIQAIQWEHDSKRFHPFRTSVIDLRMEFDAIQGRFSKDCRYEIRRAERTDDLVFKSMNLLEEADLLRFIDFYDAFARSRRLPAANVKKLVALNQERALWVSWALGGSDPDSGAPLVYHCYAADRGTHRTRLLYSASHYRSTGEGADRQRLGRANRWLHGRDMQSMKSEGFTTYDLGGLPLSDDDADTGRIGAFKRQFGGEERVEYSGLVPVSGKARIVLAARSRIGMDRH